MSIFSKRLRRESNSMALECKQPKKVLLLMKVSFTKVFILLCTDTVSPSVYSIISV